MSVFDLKKETVSVRFRIFGADGNSVFGFSFDKHGSRFFVDCALYDFATREKFDCLEKNGIHKGSCEYTQTEKEESVSYFSKGCRLSLKNGESVDFECEYEKIFTHTGMRAHFTAAKGGCVICGDTCFITDVKGEVTVCGRKYEFGSGSTLVYTVGDRADYPHGELALFGGGMYYADGVLAADGGMYNLPAPKTARFEANYAYGTAFDFGSGKLNFTPFFNDRAVIKNRITNECGNRFFGKVSGELNVSGKTVNADNLTAFYNE